MHKQLFFSVALLLSIGALYAKHAEQNHHFVILTNKALELTDGKNPGMNGDACIDCLQVRNLINELVLGKKDPATKTYIKQYNFDGKKVSLHDLVLIEQSGKLIPGTAEYAEFQTCLNAMKQAFVTFTEPLLGEAELMRNTTIKLVEEWCIKSGNHDSIMLSWGSVDEKKLLQGATATQFELFCLDLKTFLHDLMFNCPKGRELFKSERLSMIALNQAFETVSKKPGKLFEETLDATIREHITREHPTDQEHYFEVRKKRKFINNSFSEDIKIAAQKADPNINLEQFIEQFYKFYTVKCAGFDKSFTDTEHDTSCPRCQKLYFHK